MQSLAHLLLNLLLSILFDAIENGIFAWAAQLVKGLPSFGSGHSAVVRGQMFYGFGLLKFVDNSFMAYLMTLGMWIRQVRQVPGSWERRVVDA